MEKAMDLNRNNFGPPGENRITFGQWLKQRRKELGYTQSEFAVRMFISTEYLSQIERGVSRPSNWIVEQLAHALGLSNEQIEPLQWWAQGMNLSAQDLRTIPGLEAFSPPRLRIFLCHASEDKPEVRKLYKRLMAAGFSPWLDEEDLLAGQDWRLEIPKAVRKSDVVLVCLSQKAVTKAGYVQEEIKVALDVADEQPEGTIYIIPMRLEECTVPDRLSRWQWVDLFGAGGYAKVTRALKQRASTISR
jgi:transcriptional regulator with XRE-family HTH domain